MMNGSHILVVDDERDFRESTRLLLTMEGFRVSEAGSGDDAVRLVQQRAASGNPVDVVLLDFRMPGKNGGQTLRALRALGIEACAILVSAAADLETISSTFGFDDVVAKPCDFADLLAAISRCTTRTQSARTGSDN